MNIETQKTIEDFNSAKEAMEKIYLDTIENLLLPIDERWIFFKEWGKYFGEFEGWVHRFEVEKKLKNKRIDWFEEFYIRRSQTIELTEIIDRIEENLEYSEWTDDLVTEFKEEILKHNLYSFRFDW